MSRFVLDASIALAWCFPDENTTLAEQVAKMFTRGDSALAPSFWPHEILNALLAGEKRRRITQDLIDNFLKDLAVLPVGLVPSPADDVFTRVQALCREFSLTAYDAAYLGLAVDGGLPLATLHQDLIRACKKAGVDLLE